MVSAAAGGTRSPDTWALRPQGLDSAVANSSFPVEPEALQKSLTLVCRCAHPQRGVWGCGWRRPRPLRLLGFSPHTRETGGICRLLAAYSQCRGQRPAAHSLKCLHRAGGVNHPGTRSGKRGRLQSPTFAPGSSRNPRSRGLLLGQPHVAPGNAGFPPARKGGESGPRGKHQRSLRLALGFKSRLRVSEWC